MPRFVSCLTVILSVSCVLIPPCHSVEGATPLTPLQHAGFVLSDLTEKVHESLVSVVGKKTLESFVKFAQNCVKLLSSSAAAGLNVLLKVVTDVLEAAGIEVKLPWTKVSPDGVVFVLGWTLLALVAYWILSVILRLVVGVARQVLWMLKVVFAVSTFGLILSDTAAPVETTVLRIAGLVCVCVLLGMGSASSEQDSQLENKVKTLERRLREVERS